MKKKNIIMFKRSKSEELDRGIEYILCTNKKPTLMSSSLETMSSYVATLSKVNGKKITVDYSIPRDMNGAFFYDNLNNQEKNSLNDYISKRKRI